ncbi:MAG: hypothetical protein E7011_05170 [Alphaproteobacteria bacterium]|nr:hypothetical protein [Alphaproteobacteria bacterium]
MNTRNTICFLGALLFTGNAFCACIETTYTLPKGGNAAYDDYLYPSTAKYEKRNEGQTVRAYVCGQGYCAVGEKLRLKNAATGSGASRADAVYKCVNVPDPDRTGYGWQAADVDPYCTVGNDKFQYNETLKLYEYNNKYCTEIDEIKKLADALNTTPVNIEQNISTNVNVDITDVYNITIRKVKVNKRLTAADIKKIQNLINKSETEIKKEMKELGAEVEELQSEIDALQREQFWNDLVNGLQNAKLKRLARQMSGVKSQLKTKVNEEQVMELIGDVISDMELTEEQVIQVKHLIQDSAQKTRLDINQINNKMHSMNWRITKNEAKIAWVRFCNNMRNNSQDRQIQNLGDKLADMDAEILSESAIENLIEDEIKNAKLNRTQLRQVKGYIQDATRGLKVQLNKVSKRIDELGAEVEELQSEINALQREQFWDDLVNGLQNAKLKRLARQMSGVKSQLKTKVNEEQVMELIGDVISDMELTEEQVIQVKHLIQDSAQKTQLDINQINNKMHSMNWRITKNEAKIAWVRFCNNMRNNSQDRQIKKLGDKLADMDAEILSESDIENLIEVEIKNTKLNRTQLRQVKEYIQDATRGLKVQLNKVSKRIDELGDEVDKVKSELTSVKVQAWFDRLKNRFVNDFQDEKIKHLGNKLGNLKKDVKDRPTEDDVMNMIQNAIDNAELSDTQLTQVKSLINAEISSLGGDIKKLRTRLDKLSVRIGKLEVRVWWNEIQDKFQTLKIDKLDNKMKSLQSQINDKMNEDQIMDLIEQALTDATLSNQQAKQVEEIIRNAAEKANARMDRIDSRLDILSGKIRRIKYDILALKTKLALVNLENDARYKSLRNKNKKLDKAIKKIDAELNDIEKQLDSTISREEAHALIQRAVDDAATEMGTDLNAEIQTTFNQIVQDLNSVLAGTIGEIENRLTKIETDVTALQRANTNLINDLAGLQSLTKKQQTQILLLHNEVAEKTSATEVVALIMENTQSLNDAQRNDVLAMIVNYTRQLSSDQQAQVNAMIASYVEPKLKRIDADMAKVRQQEIARDKINSAMSVLNAFASGADVSVWKNAEGKFNTVRLASDAAAGVVLGTAGGLISNSIIKKNQIKKGFDDVKCSVGGQIVSDYADEFVVGVQ